MSNRCSPLASRGKANQPTNSVTSRRALAGALFAGSALGNKRSRTPEPNNAGTTDRDVASGQCDGMGARSGDDDPIGGVAVKGSRQSVYGDHHVAIER